MTVMHMQLLLENSSLILEAFSSRKRVADTGKKARNLHTSVTASRQTHSPPLRAKSEDTMRGKYKQDLLQYPCEGGF